MDTPYPRNIVNGVLKTRRYASNEKSFGNNPYPVNRIACSDENEPEVNTMNGSKQINATNPTSI